jgi:DNA-binding MarR family transcriptional regulator
MQLLKKIYYFCIVKIDENSIDFEASIGPWLGRTIKLIDYFLLESLKSNDLDLTKEQMIVLKKLHDNDGLNQNELAFLTLRNKSSLTRLLSKMENKNYILRKKSKIDKRINNVYLTQLGKDTFTKTRPVIKKIIQVMENDISENEKKQMINTLKKIQFNFNSKIESI